MVLALSESCALLLLSGYKRKFYVLINPSLQYNNNNNNNNINIPPYNIIIARFVLTPIKLVYYIRCAKFISKDPSIIYKIKASVYYYSRYLKINKKYILVLLRFALRLKYL